jgi:hypothetical protein
MSQMVSSYWIFQVKFCHLPSSVGMSRQGVMQITYLKESSYYIYRTQIRPEDLCHDNEKLPELRAVEAS